MFLLRYRNASGILGEWEMLQEHELTRECFHSFFKFFQTSTSIFIKQIDYSLSISIAQVNYHAFEIESE